jgi:hypothetical protein
MIGKKDVEQRTLQWAEANKRWMGQKWPWISNQDILQGGEMQQEFENVTVFEPLKKQQ